jgi:hypothetical protein
MKYLILLSLIFTSGCFLSNDKPIPRISHRPKNIKNLPDRVTFQELKTKDLTCGIVTSTASSDALSISCVRN